MSEDDLCRAIDENMALYVWPNAIFYAERLFALFPYAANLLRLAETYFQSGDAATCSRLLRTYVPFTNIALHPLTDTAGQVAVRRELRYLYGVSCVQSHKITEAEFALAELLPSPDGSVEYWLGVCAKKSDRINDAIGHFQTSCTTNPLMFSAFEEVTKLKAGEPQPNIYTVLLSESGNRSASPFSAASSLSVQASNPLAGAQHPSVVAPTSSSNKPTTSAARNASASSAAWKGPTAPPTPTNSSTAASTNSRFSAPPPPKFAPRATAAAVSAPNHNSNGKSSTIKPTQCGISSTHAHAPTPSTTPLSPSTTLLQLLACYAEATVLHYSFQCAEAVQYVTSEGFPERDSGWSLALAAMSHFHSNAMLDAKSFFNRLRQVEPWRLQHYALVYFSTCLWQLKDEHQLGLLTQHLMEEQPLHVVTLCVAGNCYSLARDSRMSIEMLRRATTVDRHFAYGHTLYGYELLAADEKSEAEAAFLQALARDHRHYPAYGGLGEVALRRQNFGKAEHYFMQAIHINEHPIMMNRLASMYHRDGAPQDHLLVALSMYDRTLLRFPSHATARVQRCEVLMRLQRLDEAMKELEATRTDHPDQALMHLCIGKCAHRMHRFALANDCYHKALDLDPRRAPMIKRYMDALQQQRGAPPGTTFVFPDDA